MLPRHLTRDPDFTALPDGLPVPQDDGAADHLPGTAGAVADPGRQRRALGRPRRAGLAGRTVIYLYPLTGRPGVDLPAGWDEIPGARGCSTEACDFRDHYADLRAAGAGRVWGMSSQDPDYQAEVVERLRLPFAMLSDPDFALAGAARPADVRRTRPRPAVHPAHPGACGTVRSSTPSTRSSRRTPTPQQVLAWLRANPEPASKLPSTAWLCRTR